MMKEAIMMEFNEKLQALRKAKGLTQEQLAQALFVSRTAISKWESGRGYPSIDSLKEISSYFSVSIDELLTGETLLSIAEQEHQSNLIKICHILIGFIDVSTFILIVLPLYPNLINNMIVSVNLLNYVDIALIYRNIYWFLYGILIGLGMLHLIISYFNKEKYFNILANSSMLVSILTILILALTKETYALMLIFILLMIKAFILYYQQKRSTK